MTRNRMIHWFWVGAAAGAILLASHGGALANHRHVPEMDPGLATSGWALLTGAVVLLGESWRKRRR